MTRTFTQRVQTAAYAAWCTVIIGVVWLTAAWCAFLIMGHYQPKWLITLWGGKVTWDQVHWIMLLFTAVAKMIFLVIIMAAIWLTIWGRKLSKLGES